MRGYSEVGCENLPPQPSTSPASEGQGPQGSPTGLLQEKALSQQRQEWVEGIVLTIQDRCLRSVLPHPLPRMTLEWEDGGRQGWEKSAATKSGEKSSRWGGWPEFYLESCGEGRGNPCKTVIRKLTLEAASREDHLIRVLRVKGCVCTHVEMELKSQNCPALLQRRDDGSPAPRPCCPLNEQEQDHRLYTPPGEASLEAATQSRTF